MTPSGWMDTQGAVEYAGKRADGTPVISAYTLNKRCREKKIRFGKNGREYLFKPEFIDSYFMLNGFDGRRG